MLDPWAASLQVGCVSREVLDSEMNELVFYARVYALAQRDAMMQRCFAMLKKPTD
jgi:hypothetical protein